MYIFLRGQRFGTCFRSLPNVLSLVLRGSQSCAGGGERTFVSRGTCISALRSVTRRPSEWSLRGHGQVVRAGRSESDLHVFLQVKSELLPGLTNILVKLSQKKGSDTGF